MTALPQPQWTIANVLRKARREAMPPLKQADIARILKVSRKTVSNWENGIGEPSASQYLKLADELDAPWMLGQIVGYLGRHLHDASELRLFWPGDLDEALTVEA